MARSTVNHARPTYRDTRPRRIVKRTIWYTQRAEVYRGGRFTVETAPYQIQDSILVSVVDKGRTVKPIKLKHRVTLD